MLGTQVFEKLYFVIPSGSEESLSLDVYGGDWSPRDLYVAYLSLHKDPSLPPRMTSFFIFRTTTPSGTTAAIIAATAFGIVIINSALIFLYFTVQLSKPVAKPYGIIPVRVLVKKRLRKLRCCGG